MSRARLRGAAGRCPEAVSRTLPEAQDRARCPGAARRDDGDAAAHRGEAGAQAGRVAAGGRRAGFLRTLLALLLAAGGVRAAAPPEILEKLREGQTALEAFDYDGAVKALDQVVRRFRGGELDASEPEMRRVLREALTGRATAHLGAGDLESAAGDLALLLSADPGFELDPRA